MSTKIDLQYPYSKDFVSGYLNTNSEPRKVVSLVDTNGNKTSTSYARYLMSCHLGRYLDKTEHVDHIDNNKLNDVIGNLQILSQGDNNRKKNLNLGISKTMITLVCPVCNTVFEKDCRNVRNKIKNGKKPTCSRTCGGKWAFLLSR